MKMTEQFSIIYHYIHIYIYNTHNILNKLYIYFKQNIYNIVFIETIMITPYQCNMYQLR